MKWTIIIALLLQVTVTSVFGVNDDVRVPTYIPEEQDAGYLVANMARIFSIRYNEREGRTFKLLSQTLVTKNPNSERIVDYLVLDQNTGEITTSEKLDREALCGFAKECIIQVQAVMLPNEYFTILDMDVVIEDTNDNMPIFQQKSINLSIKEGELEVGDAISLDQYKATDKDIGDNGQITYDLDNNPYFAVGTYTDESGMPHLQLRVLAEPDHEETSSLELGLTASDKGSETHSDKATLTIEITDANDNTPVFDKEEYIIKLKENDGPPHVVATVHAEDKDSGTFGTVRYSIPRPRTGDRMGHLASKLFSINEMTGEIKLKKKVDREVHDGLRILIQASDSDPVNPRVGKTWLQVKVEDVNDNAPVIKINFIIDSKNLTGYIPESASIKTYVASIKVSDADYGANGEVTTTITTFGRFRSQKELEKLDDQFHLTPSRGLLVTGRVLDRETFQYYVVRIRSCDGGTPARCSVQNITVHVLDENDNPPIFDSAAKAVMIAEDTEVGSFVLNVGATDGDSKYQPSLWKSRSGVIQESRNGIIRYSIVKGDKEVFEVDQASGDIRLRKPLDHETTKEWKLVIEARDEGWQTSSKANCSVVIRVSDVNDNLPIFVEPATEGAEVAATILREQVIMTVKALDLDAGPNSKVTYKIVEQDGQIIGSNSSSGSLFIINPTSGQLSLNFSRRNLTNQLGRHSITIEATDSGTPPLSAAVVLHINVVDELLPDPASRAGFDEKYIILALALGVASCILIIAIIAIVISRRRKNKQGRTYNCRSAEQTSKHPWFSGTLEMHNSRSETKYYTSNSVNSSQPESPKKVIHVNENRATPTPVQPQGRVTSSNDGKMTTFKNTAKPLASSAVLTTIRAMDRDSGRGDSDSENGNYGNIDETVAQNDLNRRNEPSMRGGSQRDNESTRTSELGPQCREDCLTHGHSDVCWMPPPSASGQNYSSMGTRGLKSVMTASAPTLDTPSYFDYNRDGRTNEYPTLQHLPSRQYPRHPEHYGTMSFSPNQMSDYYHQNYEGELAPIAEMLPRNQRINCEDIPCEGDDVSAQTQLTLSTSPAPMHDNRDFYSDAVSRSSIASSRDYQNTTWQRRQNWDSRFNNPSRVQRAPPSRPTNNYVKLPQDPRPLRNPVPVVAYPRKSSSSSEQSYRCQEPTRPGSTAPFEHSSNLNNPNYYYMNSSVESSGALTIQQAQGVIADVNSMFTT